MDTLENKRTLLKKALALVNILFENDSVYDKIILSYDKLLELGDQFSIKDAVEVESFISKNHSENEEKNRSLVIVYDTILEKFEELMNCVKYDLDETFSNITFLPYSNTVDANNAFSYSKEEGCISIEEIKTHTQALFDKNKDTLTNLEKANAKSVLWELQNMLSNDFTYSSFVMISNKEHVISENNLSELFKTDNDLNVDFLDYFADNVSAWLIKENSISLDRTFNLYL